MGISESARRAAFAYGAQSEARGTVIKSKETAVGQGKLTVQGGMRGVYTCAAGDSMGEINSVMISGARQNFAGVEVYIQCGGTSPLRLSCFRSATCSV